MGYRVDSRPTSSASHPFGTFPSRGRLLPAPPFGVLAVGLLSAAARGFPLRGSCRRQATDEVASCGRGWAVAVWGLGGPLTFAIGQNQWQCRTRRLEAARPQWGITAIRAPPHPPHIRSAPSPQGEGFCLRRRLAFSGGAARCRGILMSPLRRLTTSTTPETQKEKCSPACGTGEHFFFLGYRFGVRRNHVQNGRLRLRCSVIMSIQGSYDEIFTGI